MQQYVGGTLFLRFSRLHYYLIDPFDLIDHNDLIDLIAGCHSGRGNEWTDCVGWPAAKGRRAVQVSWHQMPCVRQWR